MENENMKTGLLSMAS